MNWKEELKLVTINEELGKGIYLSKDVFTGKIIKIKLTGKLRLHYVQIPVGEKVYVAIVNSDYDNARYVYTWRDPMRTINIETDLEKQKLIIDAKYYDLLHSKND